MGQTWDHQSFYHLPTLVTSLGNKILKYTCFYLRRFSYMLRSRETNFNSSKRTWLMHLAFMVNISCAQRVFTLGCQKNINMLFLDLTCYHGNHSVESALTKIIKITKLCNFFSHLYKFIAFFQ